MAYFNENDEMVITKVDMRKTKGSVPDGFVRVNLNEPIANFKVDDKMTGIKFVENLENVSKERVKIEQNKQQNAKPGFSRKVTALEVSQVQSDKDADTLMDLNPKKMKKNENIFMDFMSLYSRAAINDKGRRNSGKSSQIQVQAVKPQNRP